MDIIAEAQRALALIHEGRAVVAAIKSALSDGRTALSTDQLDALEEMLRAEETETLEASTDLKSAIAQWRSNQG